MANGEGEVINMPTNTKKLKARIIEKNYTQAQVADFLKLSYQSFSYKLNNKVEFKASEIQLLCELLEIQNKDEYFFCT